MKNKVYHILGEPVNVKVLQGLKDQGCTCTAVHACHEHNGKYEWRRFVTNGQVFNISFSGEEFSDDFFSENIVRNADYILTRYDNEDGNSTTYIAKIRRPMDKEMYMKIENAMIELINCKPWYAACYSIV